MIKIKWNFWHKEKYVPGLQAEYTVILTQNEMFGLGDLIAIGLLKYRDHASYNHWMNVDRKLFKALFGFERDGKNE